MRSFLTPCVALASLIVVAGACGSDAADRSTAGEASEVGISAPTDQSAPPTTAPPETATPTDPAETSVSVATTDAAENSGPSVTTVPQRDIGLITAIIDIEYYGACGTETLELDGETWYPLPADAQAAIDPFDYEPAESITEPAGLLRVAPPEPGDDVGTLFVYADGLGRFVSDSGRIDAWMTTEEQIFDWAC